MDVILFRVILVSFNIRIGEALRDSAGVLLISCSAASAASAASRASSASVAFTAFAAFTASTAFAASLTSLCVVVNIHFDDSKLRVLLFYDVSECLEAFRKAELTRGCWYGEEGEAGRPSKEANLYTSPWTAGSIRCTYNWHLRQYAAYKSICRPHIHH